MLGWSGLLGRLELLGLSDLLGEPTSHEGSWLGVDSIVCAGPCCVS